MIVDYRVANFNTNSARNYHPSDSICVDEFMPTWYGIREHLTNAGFPWYIEIDRNPENGCEVQNADDVVSGIPMQLKLVKTSSEEDLHSPEEHGGFLHGTKVRLNLLQPYVNKQRCVVSEDSHFSSVQACDDLNKRGLSFIVVVNTETRDFCMEKLSGI